jgi:cystathionine beta-lyase/cystathionine gamma-synthase
VQSSTFGFEGNSNYHDIRYIRFNNTPSQIRVASTIARLEGAETGLVTASGMAAISSTLLTFLKSGDHLIALDNLYGGTQNFIADDLKQAGVSHSTFSGEHIDELPRCLRPNTKLVYVESITNPLLRVPELQEIADFARQNGLISIVDNTFATPLNFRPLTIGFDLVIHSCSKYLNGHSDLVAGAVLGHANQIDRIKAKLDYLGGTLDPHACFLLERGLKTLDVRLRRQEETALKLAKTLSRNSSVSKVYYPGLEDDSQHQRAKSLFQAFSAMVSFEVTGGPAAADRVLQSLRLATVAPSLGGPETLAIRPAGSIYVDRSSEDPDRVSIPESLLRVSVGLENADEIIEDFQQALKSAHRSQKVVVC